MRDLEIRGAGNILGGEQHGHMETVGYDLYLKLLGEAVKMEKGELPSAPVDNECLRRYAGSGTYTGTVH